MKGNRGDSDRWTQRASEYLDDELSAHDRRAFEQHLTTCPDCRAAVEAVREVATRASRLSRTIDPGRDLWPDIAARLTSRRPARASWRLLFRPVGLRPALAAAAIVAIACGLMLWLLPLRPQPSAGRVSSAPSAARSAQPPNVVSGSGAGEHEREYEKTVANLQREAEARLTLDPHLVTVLDENLATLDAAIATYRGALSQQPGDVHLRSRLEQAKKRKLEVLQQAVSLAAEGTD